MRKICIFAEIINDMLMKSKRVKQKACKTAKNKKKSVADSNIDPRTGKPKSKFTLYWEKMGDKRYWFDREAVIT